MKISKDTKSLVLYWIGIGIVLNLFIELLARRNVINMFQYICFNPLIFIYNTLIIMTTLSVAALTKRRLFFVGGISLIWMIMGIINGVLLGFHIRTTPFTAQDVTMIPFALSIASSYLSTGLIIVLVVVAIVFLCSMIVLWKKSPKRTEKIPYVRTTIGIVVFLLAVLGLNQMGTNMGILATNFSNIGQAYEDYGFAYCFANSLLNTGMDKPEIYDKDIVVHIVNDEIISEDPVNDKEVAAKEKSYPNVIFVQLESFFDITKLNNIQLSKDPIPTMHKLMKEYSSGFVSVPSIGAGTVNTEFEVITGMNLDFFGPGEYPYKTVLKKTTTESIGYNLRELGYRTHVVHNNNATFYDRISVFPKLGFETFTSSEYMNIKKYTPNGWAVDSILVEEIEKALNVDDHSDFIYTISVQGHGNYPTEQVYENPNITVDGLGEEENNQYTYYVNQLYEMDSMIEQLITMLQQRQEKTVVVFYGDHLPTLGIEQENLNDTTLFQTPYVIWDNIGLEKIDKDIEAYQLNAHVLNQLDIHKGVLTRFHQKYLKEQQLDSEAFLEDFQLIQYDMLYGEKDVFEGENPYEEVDMKMGVQTIEIEDVTYQGDVLYVSGQHFTKHSVIYIDEKPIDTEFIHEKLIVSKELQLKKDCNIFVAQIDKDGVSLSQTEEVYLPIKE